MIRWRAFGLASLLLVGCGTQQPTSSPLTLFFPTVAAVQPMALGRVDGTLAILDGCLMVIPEGEPMYLVIWPGDYRARVDARGVIVQSGDGQSVTVGDPVSLVGGPWLNGPGDNTRERVEALINHEVPAECDRGRYWIGALRWT